MVINGDFRMMRSVSYVIYIYIFYPVDGRKTQKTIGNIVQQYKYWDYTLW